MVGRSAGPSFHFTAFVYHVRRAEASTDDRSALSASAATTTRLDSTAVSKRRHKCFSEGLLRRLGQLAGRPAAAALTQSCDTSTLAQSVRPPAAVHLSPLHLINHSSLGKQPPTDRPTDVFLPAATAVFLSINRLVSRSLTTDRR